MPATQGNPALLSALATEIKSRRSALGLSQEELAFRADVNRTYIAKLELGKNQPSLGVFLALASGLELDPVDFLAHTMKSYARERRASARKSNS